MKFLLLATTALAAATSPTTQALVERQGPVLQADIAAIVSSVVALQKAVSSFQGAQQADGLVASSQAVVGSITKATADAKSSPLLQEGEAVDLTGPIGDLVNKVNATVESLVSKKQVLAASGRGCEVLPQLQAQEAGTKALLAALTPKLPTSLQGVAPQLSAPIIASLAKGMAAFKDVQCTSATTSTTEAATATSASASTTTAETTTVAVTTTTTASESTATGTATETTLTGTTATATATGTAPGTAPGTVTSVATATETESCPPPETVTETKTEPCDTETAGPTGGHGTKTTDGSGSQPTGDNRGNPGSQPTGGNGEKPGSQPTGDNRGNPGSGGSGPEPTTLVPVPTGDNNGGSTSPAGSSPTSPVVVAGAARGQVCFFSVTFAAMVGAIGAVAL